jgi:CRISPR-associated endoribonuclease Cas6/Csy4 subtype I-F
MKHYFEIKVFNDKNKTISKIINCLHGFLSSRSYNDIGISLPESGDNVGLGGIIRFFSNDLNKLNDLHDNFSDKNFKIKISRIKETPNCSYISYYRYQPKMTNSKLNRLIKRGNNINRKEYIKEMISKENTKCFFTRISKSNQNKFMTFIGSSETNEIIGEFDFFGLGKTNHCGSYSSVPSF